jgi:trigger factor
MGDFVVLDYEGSIDGEPFPGGEGRDQLAELGSGRLVPGFEEQLQGARAEEERTVEITFPDDYPAEHLAGKPATFAVTVKEVKAKRLPDLDDDFATEAAGFDSLDELREDITGKLKERQEGEVENEFREAAVDAAVQNAKIDVPEALVHARAHELWERMMGALARQGISKEAYLRMADKEEEALVHEAMPEADQALRREAVLHAVVQAEGIEPTEEQLVDALRHSAEHEDTTPEKLLERLRRNNRLDPVKEDIAVRQAVDLIVESAKPIDAGRAAAREKLWKPGDAK